MTRLPWPFRPRRAPSPPDASRDAPQHDPLPPPRPARRTYAVGDVHGQRDALEAMLALIAEDAGATPHDIVFLGDYVDRGPDSAGVLRRLHALTRARADVTCLAGNHDRMMLEVIADPARGPQWLAMGGEATLFSLGCLPVPPPAEGGAAARNAARAAALDTALGPELRAWLAGLPLWWRSGTLVAVHALTDPALPMEAQDARHLLWARPPPDLAPRADGAWVVHGHTVTDAPVIRAGHVGVDTGACFGGPLTAAVFTPEGAPPRFLQTPRGDTLPPPG